VYSDADNNIENRILGGHKVSIKDYPYQVHITAEKNGKNREKVMDEPSMPGIYVYHPNYNDSTSDYDIAIIELTNNNITYTPKKQPTTLPKSGTEVRAGTNTTVSGWGYIKPNGPYSNDLRAVTLKVYPLQYCAIYYGSLVTERHICAGSDEPDQNSCQGDAGGPLVITSDKVQVGVVSGGLGCESGVPKIYTNLAYRGISDFISKYTGGS
ncbi:unnamed protein product, partial [Leptidea sinapis]